MVNGKITNQDYLSINIHERHLLIEVNAIYDN